MVEYKNSWTAKLLLILLIFLLNSYRLLCAEIKLSAYVDKNKIYIDDIITLTIEIRGTKDFPTVHLPDLDDFMIISGPSQSTSIQIINGEISAMKSVNWRLAPKRAGELIISPVTINWTGKRYKTDPVKVSVLDKSVRPGVALDQEKGEIAKGRRAGEVFFTAEPSDTVVYRGEEVDIAFNLYYKNVRTFSIKKLPEAKGFWVEEFSPKERPAVTTEVIDGEIFKKAQIHKLALFPTTAGELTVDPMIINCEVVSPRKTRRSLFDEFFDEDPFFGTPFFENVVVKSLSSQPVTIRVLPLPEAGKPANFTGAVGKFSIQSSIDTLEATCGQALTVKYEVRGTGNINTLKIPPPEFSSEFDVFEPKVEKYLDRGGGKIKGSISYEYVLIPKSEGKMIVPALSLSYFDPESKKYRGISSKSFEITVHPSDKMLALRERGLTKEEVSLLGEDIRFISSRSKRWRRVDSSPFSDLWLWILNSIAIIIVIGSVTYRWRSDKLKADVVYAKKIRAWGVSQKRLKDANDSLKSGRREEFLTKLNSALTGFISDRLGLPCSSVGTKEIEENLRSRVNDNIIVDEVVDTLGEIEKMRFSPKSSVTIDLPSADEKLFAKVRRLIAQFNRVV